jgi:hypothetical protein
VISSGMAAPIVTTGIYTKKMFLELSYSYETVASEKE